MKPTFIESVGAGACFSPCRTWRYTLWRTWDATLPRVQFIGLNPSTADETNDDPTIRRLMAFARREGCGGIVMTNVFAFRATDPNVMKQASDPVGPENDQALCEVARCSPLVVACWGVHGLYRGRASRVRKMIGRIRALKCFGRTRDGQPLHPLYLAADTPLEFLDPLLQRKGFPQ